MKEDKWGPIEELLEGLTVEDFKYGEDDYMEEEIIAYFLIKAAFHCNTRPYLHYDFNKGKDEDGNYPLCEKPEKPTIVIYVHCNDLFMWGCADSEEIKRSELPGLLEMYFKDKTWGIDKWVCRKRNERPQAPIRKMMKEKGSWEDWMDNLEENYDETDKYKEYCKENQKKYDKLKKEGKIT